MGKSAFAINEAHNIAVVNKKPLLYLDTEMQTKTFLMRLISIDSGIPIHEIETFQYEIDPIKYKKYKESEKRIKEAPLIHKYSTHWTTKKVRNDVISLVRQEGIEMVVYDYIKVKEVNESRNKEHNELGNWTIALKDLAGELNIPVLTLAQMSPYEIRVADSDKINRYASTVGFILPLSDDAKNRMKQWGYPKTKDYIYIKYNRNGASMEDENKGIYLDFNRECVTFNASKFQEEFEDLIL
nr:DnaB-like helicase C-terminal domain-containing protein [Peptoniphilus ovalis]